MYVSLPDFLWINPNSFKTKTMKKKIYLQDQPSTEKYEQERRIFVHLGTQKYCTHTIELEKKTQSFQVSN